MAYTGLLFLFMGVTVYELYILIRKTGIFCILFYMLIIQQLSRGISAAYLDQGRYNLELGNYTWNVYAGPLYFAYLSIFLLFIDIFISIANRLLNKKHIIYKCEYYGDIRISLLNFFGLFSIAYLALDMMLSGIPLLSGGSISRFNYWNDYSRLPAASLLSSLLTVICVGFGYNLGSGITAKRTRNLEIGIVTLMFVERLMLGYRVSGITDLVIGLAIGFLFRKFAVRRPSRRTVVKVVQLVVLIILTAVAVYIVTTLIGNPDLTMADVWGKLLERQLSLSGHMEWAVFNDPSSRSWGVNNSEELLSVFHGGNEMSTQYGVYGMMAEFAPTELYNFYYEDGVRFATSFIAASLFYNGIGVTLFFIALNAFIFASFYYFFRILAVSNHIFTFSLLYRVFLIFNSYINASGTLTSFYRLNVIMLIAGCVILWFIESSMQRAGTRTYVMSYAD